jgi:uncharacterized protein (DUF433 family)
MGSKLTLDARPVPLTQTENGVWRVTGTRIPLERIVECYEEGYSPEEIVDAFDTLRLADVYAVISYYLDHKEEVEEYIREQDRKADELRNRIEASQRPGPSREELMARWAQREKKDASPGH